MQHIEKHSRIIVHGSDVCPFENQRQRPLENVAVGQDVRNPGRGAKIVLEDIESTFFVAHQVGAGDVAPDTQRRIDALALPEITVGRLDLLGWNDPVLDDFLLMVDVINEQI